MCGGPKFRSDTDGLIDLVIFALVLLFSPLLVFIYRPERDRPAPMRITTAAVDLPPGTVVGPALLAVDEIEGAEFSDALVEAREGRHLVGRTVLQPVRAGEPLRWSHLRA